MQINNTSSLGVLPDYQAQEVTKNQTVSAEKLQSPTNIDYGDKVTISAEAESLLQAETGQDNQSELNTGGTGIEPPKVETDTGGTGIEPPKSETDTGGTGIEPPESSSFTGGTGIEPPAKQSN